jgi:hypothetical protein
MKTTTSRFLARAVGLALLACGPLPAHAALSAELTAFASRIAADYAAQPSPAPLADYLSALGIEAGPLRDSISAQLQRLAEAKAAGLRVGSDAYKNFFSSTATSPSMATDSARAAADASTIETVVQKTLGKLDIASKSALADALKIAEEARASAIAAKQEAASAKVSATTAEAKVAVSATAAQVAETKATSAVSSAAETKKELNKFDGLGFGTGLALTLDLGSNERIKKASLDSARRIRVEEDTNVTPRFIIETHKLFLTEKGAKKFNRIPDDGKTRLDEVAEKWTPDATGLFVCAEPGGDTINSLGAGLMLAWASETDNQRKVVRSFNLSLGVLIDQNVQILGDGLKAGMVLPIGEEIRYRKTSQAGLVLMFSAGF